MQLPTGMCPTRSTTCKSFSRSAFAFASLLHAAACMTAAPAQSVREQATAASSAPLLNDAPVPGPSASTAEPQPVLRSNPEATPPSSASVVATGGASGSSAESGGATSEPSNQTHSTPSVVRSKVRKRATPSKRPTFWFCYLWVHLRVTMYSCFDTLEECRANSPRREGFAIHPCMAEKKPSWCTEPHPVPEEPNVERSEQCFDSKDKCEAHRAFVQGNGLESTPCVEVPNQ